jgi:hypothetical protein
VRRFVVAALIGGCGFHAVEPARDLSVPDLAVAVADGGTMDAGTDGAPPPIDLAGLPLDGGGACPQPFVLVAVKNAAGGPGRVLRLPLPTDGGQPPPCAPLVAQGLMPIDPQAVAWLPPSHVAVAGATNVALVDSMHDTIEWLVPNPSSPPLVPVDAFPMQDTIYADRIGVAFAAPGDATRAVTLLVAYLAKNSEQVSWNIDRSPALIGPGVKSLTAHPTAPTHILALVPGSENALDVDPWAYTKKSLASCCGTGTLLSISAALFRGSEHVVWATDVNAGRAAAHYMEDLSAGGLPSGPAQCGSLFCASLHAVPDPTADRGIVLLCDQSGTRQVLRFDSFGTPCQTLLDGATLPNEIPTRLAIAN